MRDVIIVGAGPAGGSAAIALARRGWDVLLVERDRLPRHKVCGEFLSPEAQTSLHRLQVHADLAALAPAPLTTAALTTPLGATIETPLPGEAWGLSRYALDATLAAAAERHGAEFWPTTTVTASEQMAGQFIVKLRRRGERQAQTVSARAVLMACGRHSTADLPPHNNETTAAGWRRCVGLKCHYEQVRMPARVELFLTPGGYGGINPIEGERANVCLLMGYDAFEQAGKSVLGAIQAVAERHPRLARLLAPARPVAETICAVAPVDTGRPAEPWVGMACLGDTATMIPPLCGDGMAMAFRAAELCVPDADAYLRGNLSLAGWAENYRRAWRAEFAGRVRLGRLLQRLLTRPLAGDALVRMGQALPGLANYLVRATRGSVSPQPSSAPPLSVGAGR